MSNPAGKKATKKKRSTYVSKSKLKGLPSSEILLDYLGKHPDRAGKREIAKHFGLKGEARVALKRLIAELQDDGLIVKSGKRLSKPGELPPVGVIDIITRDRDGGLLAKYDGKELNGEASPIISVSRGKGKAAVTAGLGDRALARLTRIADKGVEYSAKIIKVIDKRNDTVLGVLRIDKTPNGSSVRLEPTQRKSPELNISIENIGEAKDGDLVEVEPIRSGRYGLKNGKVTAVVGSQASEKAASLIAIYENDIRHVFPDSVIEESEAIAPIGPNKSHEDWRDLPLITIDPADAKDHDDAIFAKPDTQNESGGEGGHIVYVAIADVSYYVRPGSELDKEAVLRGNSVYFPDRVVPMLPERISNNLCSLRELEDRPALAVRMVFAADGRKIKHTFHRVLMKSHAKLAYVEAQNAIDGAAGPKAKPILKSILEPLWEAYACLKRGRDNRQPLELDLPERKIMLKEDGTVDRVIVPDRLDAHKLVEEFMIQANVAAAETLERKKQQLIYRIHDAPSLAKLESLREFLGSLDMTLAKPGQLRPMHFNGILAKVAGADNETLVNQVVLRSQSQAEYNPDNIGHFGLNLARYAHFTSPIRRYADLIVHRALVGSLGLGEGGITPDEESRLDAIAADISLTERRAMVAERSTIDRLIAAHLSEHMGERFMGRINGTNRAGLFITLADTGADGFVPVSQLGDEYFIFDEANFAMVGEKTGQTYQMGMEVEVRLVEAAPVAGALRFEMLSEGAESSGIKRSRRTNGPG